MKIYFFLFVSSAMFFTSCKEILPKRESQTVLSDTTYVASVSAAPQSKRVLVEEYTGTSCNNCPEGHVVLKNLISTYGDKIAVYGLHFGDLAKPAHVGGEDFRTINADEITAALGVGSMPSATIDRIINTASGGSRVFGRGEWNTGILERVNQPVNVNIKSKISYDNIASLYILELEFEVLEDISDNLSYTIVLAEDNIMAPQKSGSITLEEYEQEHVTRKFYTNSLGNSLKKATGLTRYEKGRTYKKSFYLTDFKPNWKPENMYVTAFVSNEATKEVIQSSIVHLK